MHLPGRGTTLTGCISHKQLFQYVCYVRPGVGNWYLLGRAARHYHSYRSEWCCCTVSHPSIRPRARPPPSQAQLTSLRQAGSPPTRYRWSCRDWIQSYHRSADSDIHRRHTCRSWRLVRSSSALETCSGSVVVLDSVHVSSAAGSTKTTALTHPWPSGARRRAPVRQSDLQSTSHYLRSTPSGFRDASRLQLSSPSSRRPRASRSRLRLRSNRDARRNHALTACKLVDKSRGACVDATTSQRGPTFIPAAHCLARFQQLIA